METIGIHEARRLALARAGLLKPEWTGYPKRTTGRLHHARKAAYRVIQRIYGYYCLPVLAGDSLVARVDLKADWKAKRLHVLSQRFEVTNQRGKAPLNDCEAVRTAIARYAKSLALKPVGIRQS